MDYSGCRPLGCQNPASLSALTNNLKIIILTWDDFQFSERKDVHLTTAVLSNAKLELKKEKRP